MATKICDWNGIQHPKGNMRVRAVIEMEWDGQDCVYYEWQIWDRPFWFGWFKKKRWIPSITSNDYNVGFEFSKHLLKIK